MTPLPLQSGLLAAAMAWADGQPPEVPDMPSYGSLLLQTILALLLVCVLAYVLLRYGLKWLLPKREGSLGAMDVVDRLPLDGRRTLYLVKLGERVFVLAATDSQIQSVGEVSADEIPGLAAWEAKREAQRSSSAGARFKEVLDGVLKGRSSRGTTPDGGESDGPASKKTGRQENSDPDEQEAASRRPSKGGEP